jgi:hypothetical protein
MEPVITSLLDVQATVGVIFKYSITATNDPTSYNAIGLPIGLSVNIMTGSISGTPIIQMVSNVTIIATNEYGTASDTLVITINK